MRFNAQRGPPMVMKLPACDIQPQAEPTGENALPFGWRRDDKRWLKPA
jgi:hypothetical protein